MPKKLDTRKFRNLLAEKQFVCEVDRFILIYLVSGFFRTLCIKKYYNRSYSKI